jgi:hypothetical protein
VVGSSGGQCCNAEARILKLSNDVALYIQEFSPLFRRPAGDPEIFVYGDTPIHAGDLKAELHKKISAAPVFMCFLNGFYEISATCTAEFDLACAIQSNSTDFSGVKRLFVPIILDQRGLLFWTKNIQPDKPAAWARELVYLSLIDEITGSRAADIYIDGKANGPISRRIQQLGKQVKELMNW